MQFTIDTDLAIAGVILGLIAIVMAAPPLLQMIYGRPQLEFEATEFTGPDGKQLIISIKNIIIKNRLLKWLRVERATGNILAFFDIQEQGSNRFIRKDISGSLHNAATRENVLLAEAHPAFTIGLPVVHTKASDTWIVDARSENLEHIAVGDYTALVTIICGEQVQNIRRNFKVGNEQHLTFWV